MGTTGQPGQSKQQATVPAKDHVQNTKMESDQEIEYTFDFFNHVCMCTHTWIHTQNIHTKMNLHGNTYVHTGTYTHIYTSEKIKQGLY